MYILSGMSITAEKQSVLETLRKNRDSHKTMVIEARTGYVEKARAALEKKLAAVKEGKIVALSFTLKPPLDYSAVYDTAIKMLEMHSGASITLDATLVHNLIEDNWDWTREFLVSNSAYSASARERLGVSPVQDD